MARPGLLSTQAQALIVPQQVRDITSAPAQVGRIVIAADTGQMFFGTTTGWQRIESSSPNVPPLGLISSAQSQINDTFSSLNHWILYGNLTKVDDDERFGVVSMKEQSTMVQDGFCTFGSKTLALTTAVRLTDGIDPEYVAIGVTASLGETYDLTADGAWLEFDPVKSTKWRFVLRDGIKYEDTELTTTAVADTWATLAWSQTNPFGPGVAVRPFIQIKSPSPRLCSLDIDLYQLQIL